MRWIVRVVLVFVFVQLPSTLLQASSPNLESNILITGRVTSANGGAPLADVAVVFVDNDFPLDIQEAARTDSSGHYTVTETLFDSWLIRFNPPDYMYHSEFYDNVGVLNPEQARIFVFAPEMVQTGIDAALTAVGEGQISGEVTAAATGDPVRNLQVDVYDEDGKWITSVGPTDSRGAYTVTELAEGGYKLYFKPGEEDPFLAAEYFNNKATLAAADVIQVGAAEHVEDIDVALDAGGMITGFVTSQGFALLALVDAFDSNGQLVATGTSFGSLDHSYTIPNLLPGDYRLLLKDRDNQHRPEYYDNQAALDAAQPVTVEAGVVTANIDAELTLTPTVSSIATSQALTGAIVLTLQYDAMPRYTNDGGDEWHEVAATPWAAGKTRYELYFSSLGLVPREDFSGQRILYNSQQKIYRSGDNGHTWAERGPVTECTGEPSFGKLVTSPINPEQLYVIESCLIFTDTGFYTAQLLMSEDGGISWQTLNTPVDQFKQVVPSPVLPDRLYIQSGNEMWHVTSNGGAEWTEMVWEDEVSPLKDLVPDGESAELLYGWQTPFGPPYIRVGLRSENGGESWVEWAEQPCINFDGPHQLLAHPDESRVLFALCGAGLFRSDNGGDAWEQLEMTPGQMLAFDAGMPGRLLWAKDDGLWASMDQGESWQNIMPEYVASPAQSLVPIYLPSIVRNETDGE